MNNRRLVVMRHAKSSWKDNLPDHERPLSGRGRRDGRAAGELFVKLDLAPSLVCSSTSVRTRQTLERLAIGGAELNGIQFSRDVYHAEADDLLEIVRAQPDQVESFMLLGHWPAVQDVVGRLARREHTDHWRALTEKFPTSALAIVDLPGRWADAGNGAGRLVSFHVPRGKR